MTIHLSRRRDIAAWPAVLLAPLLGLGACASASGVRLGAEVFPARAADHPILVFDSDEPPARPHLRIGRVVGEGADFDSFAGIVDAIRVEARRLGGDAIVLLGGGLLLRGGGGGEGESISVDRTVQAAVIRWQ